MARSRALFVSIPSLEGSSGAPVLGSGRDRLQVGLDELGDYAAEGFTIILVTRALRLGDRTFDSRGALLDAVRNDPRNRYRAPVEDVIVLEREDDPEPFWDSARKHNLSLAASTFVSDADECVAAARNAGLAHIERSRTMFRLAA